MTRAAEGKPKVAVVVLTFNCREAARRCLESLRDLTYPSLDVIVVDNASADDTEAMVRSAFPQFDFIATGANLGYTGGNNRGIARALERGADYVLIVNPDTIVVNRSFVDALVEFMEEHREVGIAGPRVFLRIRGATQNTVLFAPGLFRNIVHWFRYRINPRFAHCSGDEVVDAEVLNGVCILLRGAALVQTGVFDEDIFMYIEDADLDYRMHRAGWRVVYVPVDSIVHEQKTAGYDMFSDVSFLLRRNSVHYLIKTRRSFQAWGFAALSVLLMLARSISGRAGSIGSRLRFTRALWESYWRLLVKRDTRLPAMPNAGGSAEWN